MLTKFRTIRFTRYGSLRPMIAMAVMQLGPVARRAMKSKRSCTMCVVPWGKEAEGRDSAMKCESVVAAIIRASVVLPVPGGPQKIMECVRPCTIAWRNGFPSASRCS